MAFVLIALAVVILIALIFLIRAWLFGRYVVKGFEHGNTIVDGHKGKGKDLVFQYVINKRKKPYYANIDYGGEHTNISCREISIEPNTYDNFINDKVTPIKREFVENKDFYISDGGIFLPSYADSTLLEDNKPATFDFPMLGFVNIDLGFRVLIEPSTF